MTLTEEKPQISVVMAVHNCERYLEEAVKSILNQTFKDFEFNIIDEGSTDGSRDTLRRLTVRDSRIVAIQQDNVGLTKSLNRGLALAKGEYIARMDADDIALPERLQKQLDAFNKDPELVLLGAGVELISEDGLALGLRSQPSEEAEIRRRLLIGDGGALTHPVVMFRRDTVNAIGGYDERFTTTQDLDLFIRLAEQGGVCNLPETLLKWRQHGGSVNHTKSSTWMKMKRMAIQGSIERMGVESFVEGLFPAGETYAFPADNLALARFARAHGRKKSAKFFLNRAIREPKTRMAALEDFIEQQILGLWWLLRNGLRKIRCLIKRS